MKAFFNSLNCTETELWSRPGPAQYLYHGIVHTCNNWQILYCDSIDQMGFIFVAATSGDSHKEFWICSQFPFPSDVEFAFASANILMQAYP